MCESGRLKSFLASPPCATFSPAAYPPLRSYREPLGFDRRHPRVLLGNRLAFACLTLMMVALRVLVAGLLETPQRSKLRWTPHWRALVALGELRCLLLLRVDTPKRILFHVSLL